MCKTFFMYLILPYYLTTNSELAWALQPKKILVEFWGLSDRGEAGRCGGQEESDGTGDQETPMDQETKLAPW